MRALNRLLFLVALLLAGCSSPPTASETARLNAFVTRWADVRERRPVPRTAFTANDTPVAVVQNLGVRERIVLIEFVHQDTNQSIFKEGTTIQRNGSRVMGPRFKIPSGSYLLRVTTENSPPLTQFFTVYGG